MPRRGLARAADGWGCLAARADRQGLWRAIRGPASFGMPRITRGVRNLRFNETVLGVLERAEGAGREAEEVDPMASAALGRGWSDDELAGWLRRAGLTAERPTDVADEVAEILANEEIGVRVVSMPSWERFAALAPEDREAVLPPAVRARVAVEAASPFGWERHVGEAGAVVGMERFGASAPGERLFTEFGFTPERVAEVARAVLARLGG